MGAHKERGVQKRRATLGLQPHDTELEWQDEASCLGADSNLFFSKGIADVRAGGDTEKRLAGRYLYCLPSADNDNTECPVRQQCLEYALKNDERYGIWGGMTTKERGRLLHQRYSAIITKATNENS